LAVLLFDSQFDDKHGVLRNKLDLRDASELEPHIARLSFLRVLELEHSPVSGRFDIQHIRAIHRYILQDVFPWAGDFREVMTSRTGSFGFPPPVYILPALETLFAALRAEDWLRKLDADRFAVRAGHYLGEINAVHPSAGHRLSWVGLTPEENNAASRISFATGDSSGLAALIRKRLL
jgi:cell filamentation protein